MLVACKELEPSLPPYEVSILQDFAQQQNFADPKIEASDFQWQEGEEKLTVQ